jgi:hypothetical protein
LGVKYNVDVTRPFSHANLCDPLRAPGRHVVTRGKWPSLLGRQRQEVLPLVSSATHPVNVGRRRQPVWLRPCYRPSAGPVVVFQDSCISDSNRPHECEPSGRTT